LRQRQIEYHRFIITEENLAMLGFPESLQAWGTAAFPATLKRELAAQASELPLQQALCHASALAPEAITVILLDTRTDAAALHIKVGVFFAGILAGCSCADDPTPVEPQTEYCELMIDIDPANASATLTLLTDGHEP